MNNKNILEIGTIIKYTTPKSIEIGLNGEIGESKEKDITYYQIEGLKRYSKYGFEYLDYKCFNLNKSKYQYINSYFIKDCINRGSMEIIDNEKGVKNCDN